MLASADCSYCLGITADKPSTIHLKQIGRVITDETEVGRGYARTTHTFLQCPDCGSVWMELADYGAGGSGKSWHNLTAKYF
jgi:hypothetical protein